MKKIIGFVLAFCIGIFLGFGGVLVCIGLFSDMTIVGFLEKFAEIEVFEMLGVIAFSILSAIVGGFLQILLHESGHLVLGLCSGYKFVSFRIFNYTILKTENGLKVKKFAIAGTGGQCLMLPPDCSPQQLPVFWYNIGGVLFNVLFAASAVAVMCFADVHELLHTFLALFALLGVFFALLNGIPIKLLVSNDGMNVKRLCRSVEARRIFAVTLKTNKLVMEGARPKDMPEECFSIEDEIDFKDYFALQIYNNKAARYIDMKRYDDALRMFEAIVAHKEEVLGLFYTEAVCEVVYLALLKGDTARAEELLDDATLRYINQYSKVMSSKLRLLCAISLLKDNDAEKAVGIYHDICTKRNDYLMQGEVNSDIALIETMFKMKGLEYGK